MGLFDSIAGQVLGQLTQGNEGVGGFMQAVGGLINHHPGGLQGLVQAFEQQGLGGVVASWVGAARLTTEDITVEEGRRGGGPGLPSPRVIYNRSFRWGDPNAFSPPPRHCTGTPAGFSRHPTSSPLPLVCLQLWIRCIAFGISCIR